MASLELRHPSATRENVIAMVTMREKLRLAAPRAGYRDEKPAINEPDIQLDMLHDFPERTIAAFYKNQMLGFMDLGDWRWGHQKEFETEFDFLGNTGRPHIFDDDETRLEGNPMGILALHADDLKSAELGGQEVVMKELVEAALDRADGREIRTPMVAASSFDGQTRVDTDPARRVVTAHGFESTARVARFGRINYELFIRAAQ